MTTDPLAWLSGRYLPFSQIALSPLDAGLMWGATVTDRSRTFARRLFRWPDHLARFRHDCLACHVPLPFGDAELTAAAETLVNQSTDDVSLVMFATPGVHGIPTTCLHTLPLPVTRNRPFFTHGVSLTLVGDHPIWPAGLLPPQVKHRSRMVWWIAEHIDTAPSVAILRDPLTGSLTETAIGNLLVIRDGTVLSPPRSLILGGISLRVVVELCHDLGIPFAEQVIRPDDLAQADEAMLTGTTLALAGVSRFENRTVSWPGPTFARLLTAWSERVGLNIAEQFLSGR